METLRKYQVEVINGKITLIDVTGTSEKGYTDYYQMGCDFLVGAQKLTSLSDLERTGLLRSFLGLLGRLVSDNLKPEDVIKKTTH